MASKNSTVRRRVCHVAASVTLAGRQETAVRVVEGFEGDNTVAIRIGTLLVYIEDSKALTALVEAVVTASMAGNKALPNDRDADARRAAAWKAMHRLNRTYA